MNPFDRYLSQQLSGDSPDWIPLLGTLGGPGSPFDTDWWSGRFIGDLRGNQNAVFNPEARLDPSQVTRVGGWSLMNPREWQQQSYDYPLSGPGVASPILSADPYQGLRQFWSSGGFGGSWPNLWGGY